MRFAGLEPQVNKGWGGLVTTDDQIALVRGASPFLQDVEFQPGTVKTRSGLKLTLTIDPAGNPLWMKTFVALDNVTRRLLVFDANGSLWKEVTPGSLTLIQGAFGNVSAVKSVTLFGREFIAMSDGKIGTSPPLQFREETDGSSRLDRVSTCAPGGAVTAVPNIVTAGDISLGQHSVVVMFVTRNGYITAPSPSTEWIGTGADTVDITGIPTGPPGLVVGRILAFTQADDSRYFWIEGAGMVINDNTTTSVLGLNFDDATLASGTALEDQDVDLFNLSELPPQAGFGEYNGRLVGWGGKNDIQGARNLSFDGGFNGDTPLGWIFLRAGYLRRSGVAGSTGDALQITGAGAGTANPSALTNGSSSRAWLATILEPAKEYKVRVRALAEGTDVLGGGLSVYAQDTSLSDDPGSGFVIPFASLSAEFQSFEGVFYSSSTPLTNKMALRISGSGHLSIGANIVVDSIEIFPTEQPNTGSLVYFSLPDQPEAFDDVNGFVQVAKDNGQDVRCCFPLRGNYYIVKEESLFVTRDSGDVPGNWEVDLVDDSVGTPSLYGVAPGEEGWVVIVGKNGCFHFDGGAPRELSLENQKLWQRINFDYGEKIRVAVDPLRNLVYIAVPLDGATANTHILVLDYTLGFDYSMDAPGASRKWSVWTIATPFIGRTKRASQVWETDVATADGSGRIALIDQATLADFGARQEDGSWTGSFIDARYSLAYFGPDSSRVLFGGYSGNVAGNGGLLVTLTRMDGTTLTGAALPLHDPAPRDFERLLAIHAERVDFTIALADVPGNYMIVRKFAPMVGPSPYAPYRGWNG